MKKYWLGSLVALGCIAAASVDNARAYSQLCAGAAVPGVSGPITNGSSCQQTLGGTSLQVVYLGSEAADEDIVSLNGANIIDNRTSGLGASAILPLAPGALPFALTNVTTGQTYSTATAYANTGGFSQVYHLAYFDVASEADFNSLFAAGNGTGGVTMTAVENAFILENGGYSAFTFVGVEDLASRQWDDWNDLVFAFTDPGGNPQDPNPPPFTPSVPEPSTWAMMLVGLSGLAFASYRRARSVTGDVAA